MICPFCGGEIPDNSSECFICGELIMKQVPEGSLGKGITILSDPTNSSAQASKMPYSYGSPRDYSASRNYDEPTIVPKKSNKTAAVLIAALALIVIAIVACAKFGIFDNKDGVYNVQNLDEVVQKVLAAEGLNMDIDSVEFETAIIVDGNNCTFRNAVYYQGEMVTEQEFYGTIKFSGTKVSIDWENKSGMGTATYSSKDKSLTFDLNNEDAALYGMENLVFVKETQ